MGVLPRFSQLYKMHETQPVLLVEGKYQHVFRVIKLRLLQKCALEEFTLIGASKDI